MPLLSTLKDELAKAQTIAHAAALAATEAKEKAAIAAAKKDLAKNPNKKLRDTARNTANAANDAQAKAVETAAAAKHMAEKVSAAQQERASTVTVAQTAVTQIKQPSAISKVVTRVLNSIKIVANLFTKVIIAPFVLTGRAIAAVGQVVAKVAKAINPIAAYKNHKAKKAAVAQEVKDFDAAFGQGLNLTMQVLADEHKNASAVKRTVRFSNINSNVTTNATVDEDYSDMPPLVPADADDNDSLNLCCKK